MYFGQEKNMVLKTFLKSRRKTGRHTFYQVGIMSGNQTRPKCFDTSQWMSSSP